MKHTLTKRLAITLAFTLGALAISAAGYLLAAAGSDFGTALRVESWPRAVGIFVGDALLAGLLVDGLRWTGDLLWPKALTSRSDVSRT